MMMLFGLAAVISIGLAYVPWGRNVIYPFALLATWAHEMGHGIGALVTGHRFVELEVYSNLGGVAITGDPDGLAQIIVSGLGLVGPALLGAVAMILGARQRTAPYVLGAISAVIVVSSALWVRNVFGFFAMLAIAGVLALVAKFGSPVIRVVATQLVAIQLGLSAWSNRDYLFISGFERDGQRFDSDTQQIANELFLPFWFWGALLGGLSILIVVWAFWVAWLRPISAERSS